MSNEFYRESPGKFDSRTLSRKTLSRWTGRMLTHIVNDTPINDYIVAYIAGTLPLNCTDMIIVDYQYTYDR